MKRVISIFLFSLVLAVTAGADDGSWNKSFSVQGGSIYSDTDHPDISLDKELLVFDGEKTTAVFLFRNTSHKAVTVECGFPVRHEIDCNDCGTHLEIPSGPYGGGRPDALDWFETVQLYDPEETDETMYTLPEGILLNDFNNSREFIDPGDAGAEVDFRISADGRQVPITGVLLERSASKLGAAITWHFRHALSFKPGELKEVQVEYRQDILYGGGWSDVYRWDYIIGTGATWKGPIGIFLLVLPSGWKGYPPYLELLAETDGFLVFGRRDWEPDRFDSFSLTGFSVGHMEQYEFLENELPELKTMWHTGSPEAMQPLVPVLPLVKGVTASSSLPDRLNIFTAEGVVDGAGFGPISAFDGLSESSWCEGASGDGIGEYLQCTLAEPVWSITIRNGFTRFPAADWMFADYSFEDSIRDDALGIKDYFSMNNRVKTLEISTPGGEVLYTLNLADRRDTQTFSGIFLPAKTLHFIIREVYPGSRWSDTCLAEMSFTPVQFAPDLIPWLEDPFFGENLKGFRF
jgi:hypothetical protein